MIAARGESDLYAFGRNDREPERARVTSLEGQLVSLARWPNDQGLWIAGGAAIPAWKAHVALFDPREMRFLPGSYELGEGIVARMRPDGRGRIFLLLPWAGRVTRLSPR